MDNTFLNSDHKTSELSALDELYQASLPYRSSGEYMELMQFIGRFKRYAPLNCMLLHIQNPNISYVASITDWARKFNRRPKSDVRPLLILQPFGPVMFLYDIADTHGDPVPDAMLRTFDTKGEIPGYILANTIWNSRLHGIEVHECLKNMHFGGVGWQLTKDTRKQFSDLSLSANSKYLILLNKDHSPEEQYSSLAHELGHIFCGHLGVDKLAWWSFRMHEDHQVREVEADSVAYLVCRRIGLIANSDRYLLDYITKTDKKMPSLSIDAVLHAVEYIEQMSGKPWKKPKKKPKKKLKKKSALQTGSINENSVQTELPFIEMTNYGDENMKK